MKIYNSLTNKKENFKTVNPKKLNMYVCGPTVYNYIHIGNARPVVFFDVVKRFFLYKSYEVNYVVNITDVDDKIILESEKLGIIRAYHRLHYCNNNCLINRMHIDCCHDDFNAIEINPILLNKIYL